MKKNTLIIIVVIFVVLIGGGIAFYFLRKKKKTNTDAPPPSSQDYKINVENEKELTSAINWLTSNWKILEKYGLKKGSNFEESKKNFEEAVKNVEQADKDELNVMGYDPNAIDWIKQIFYGFSAGKFQNMEEGIKKSVEYVKNM